MANLEALPWVLGNVWRLYLFCGGEKSMQRIEEIQCEAALEIIAQADKLRVSKF